MSEHQPQGQFPPPTAGKRTSTAKIVAITVAGVLALLMVVGALSGGTESGTAGGEPSAPVKRPTSAPPDSPAPSKPSAVQEPTATTKPPAQKPTPTGRPPAPKPTATAKPSGPQVACAQQDDRKQPCAVKVGLPFQRGRHTVLAGWKPTDSGYGMTITGKARNTGDKPSAMVINVKFLRGDEVLADIMCSTGQLAPGQFQAIRCIPNGTYTRKYDKVTAQASF